MSKPVILTGIRANNDLTLGNYFGGILPTIDMAKKHADEYQINMFIPDLHSFTTPIDHSSLYEQILHNAYIFAAAGLPLENPNIYLYRQSYIPAHSELTWILDCFTSFGVMSRMTQFKEKADRIDYREEINKVIEHSKEMKLEFGDDYNDQRFLEFIKNYFSPLQVLVDKQEEEASVGLFNYPVLMAADILLYGAKYIPVGDDQTQHLEFTRDIAERMNNRFGELFTIPEPVKDQHAFFGKEQGLRIMDLLTPTKKMSKSDESGRGVIFLGDDSEEAYKKVMGATTDDRAEIHLDRVNQPGISNLLEILALLRGAKLEDVVSEFEGQRRYGDFKKVVAEAVKSFLIEFQHNLANVDRNTVLAKLEQSERDLTPVANETLLKVQQAVGLRPKV